MKILRRADVTGAVDEARSAETGDTTRSAHALDKVGERKVGLRQVEAKAKKIG